MQYLIFTVHLNSAIAGSLSINLSLLSLSLSLSSSLSVSLYRYAIPDDLVQEARRSRDLHRRKRRAACELSEVGDDGSQSEAYEPADGPEEGDTGSQSDAYEPDGHVMVAPTPSNTRYFFIFGIAAIVLSSIDGEGAGILSFFSLPITQLCLPGGVGNCCGYYPLCMDTCPGLQGLFGVRRRP